jgi:hypothetical protein
MVPKNKEILEVETEKVMTMTPGVYPDVVESIRGGIEAGDRLPESEAIPTGKLKGRIPSMLFNILSNGCVDYLLISGNHRGAAYQSMEKPMPIRVTDSETIQYHVNEINKHQDSIKLRYLSQLERLPGNALEQRMSEGNFYRSLN